MKGSDLQAFKWYCNPSLGYIELMVTLGEGNNTKTIDSKILAVSCRNVYNCILGGPFEATLDVVISPVHLEMKYHNFMTSQ